VLQPRRIRQRGGRILRQGQGEPEGLQHFPEFRYIIVRLATSGFSDMAFSRAGGFVIFSSGWPEFT